jgi:hypothetical protein
MPSDLGPTDAYAYELIGLLDELRQPVRRKTTITR